MKRGSSGLSLLVGVDKPTGVTSHDVVNRCRRIFGERRCGHTGTLDPAASGVLPMLVGPATRLSPFMTAQRKTYVATIVFGKATDTDDAEGTVIAQGPVPDDAFDPVFATSFIADLEGSHHQLPPAYSAIKVDGVTSYEAARAGRIIALEPRSIEIYRAELLGVAGLGLGEEPSWQVRFEVSKGTYIRALARDLGKSLGCPAHLGALRRERVGLLSLESCVSLETLEEIGVRAALDPLMYLGMRFAFADDQSDLVSNGNPLRVDRIALFESQGERSLFGPCGCTAGICESRRAPEDGEKIALVMHNKLKAIYGYHEASRTYRAQCVFQTGVIRGCDL